MADRSSPYRSTATRRRKRLARHRRLTVELLESRLPLSGSHDPHEPEMWPDWVDDQPLQAAAAATFPAAGALPPPDRATIVDNGPSSNRVDMVFLGDGYRASDIDTVYLAHINAAVQYMFQQDEDPYPRYAKFFNVHRINVISNETGADVPPQDIFRDTALDASYYWDGVTERLLYVNNSKAGTQLAAGLAGAPFTAEMKFVTVNDAKYGGGGGTYAVYAGANPSATDVAVHEVAHSFSGLADEYQYNNNSTYTGSEPGAVNVTKSSTGAKWSNWLGYTDPDHPAIGAVGAFQGAMYNDFGIYRPTNNSKMRSLGQPFNAVSREKIIRDIYALVDPLDAWKDNAVTVSGASPQVWVDTVDPAVISVEWKVNGAVVPGASGETFSPAAHGFGAGTYTVAARAYDPTPWVRGDRTQLEQTVSWTIEIVNEAPTIVTAAAATPNPVMGTTTTLSVLAADDGGEAAVTYTWAVTARPSGAALPSFSVNGTNGAKSSVATLTRAGSYTFEVTARDAGGLAATSSVEVTVEATLTSIVVTPAGALLAPLGTQQYAATSRDQFGDTLATQPPVIWSLASGAGGIDAAGLYTADTFSGAFSVSAASGTVQGTASGTVNSPPTVAVPAAATPNPVLGTTATFSVLGADDGGEAGLVYTWSVVSKPAGAADPAFSPNGSNAAKSTEVVFVQSGAYVLRATIADPLSSVVSDVSVTVDVAPAQNDGEPFDVNSDSEVNTLDLIDLIGLLVDRGAGPAPVPLPSDNPPLYPDVNGDREMDVLDLVDLIAYLVANPPVGTQTLADSSPDAAPPEEDDFSVAFDRSKSRRRIIENRPPGDIS